MLISRFTAHISHLLYSHPWLLRRTPQRAKVAVSTTVQSTEPWNARATSPPLGTTPILCSSWNCQRVRRPSTGFVGVWPRFYDQSGSIFTHSWQKRQFERKIMQLWSWVCSYYLYFDIYRYFIPSVCFNNHYPSNTVLYVWLPTQRLVISVCFYTSEGLVPY